MRHAAHALASLLPLLLAACGEPTGDRDAGADAPAILDGAADTLVVDAAPPPAPIAAAAPFVQYVDPTVGTGGQDYNDLGSVHPGPQMPFGMIRPGPDTVNADGNAAGFTHCSGYHARDEYISGFSHTRMHGVGINDYNVVAFMPTLGFSAASASADGLRSHFDKTRERATASSYTAVLDDPRFGEGLTVEMTAARRAAVSRVTFPMGTTTDAAIVVDLGHTQQEVDVVDGALTVLPDAREIEGRVRFEGGYSGRFGGMDVYFVMRFSRPFASAGTWDPPAVEGGSGTLHEGETDHTGPSGGAFVRFDLEGEREVRVAVAISFLDVARARMNLEAEASDVDFIRMRGALEAAWEERLSQIEVEARFERELRLFYTALYHSFFMPTLATEADGHYRGLDGMEHVADGFTYYTDFSLWDTYRTMHSLVAWLAPEVQRDFVRSLIAMGQARGAYPRWPLGTGETGGMLGDPAVIVIADSYLRGITDFDLRAAYDVALASADADPPGGRGSMEAYLRLGYAPIESGGSAASKTMEFAYADHAVGVLAEALGETDDAARFAERRRNYQHLFDPAQGFFVGRHEDGSFETVREDRWEDVYAEGNARQYLWLAPEDPDGLAETLGGREAALARLRTFFDESYAERRTPAPPKWYWQGNEPDIHAPYLFALWGDRASGARAIRWVRDVSYDLGPSGLPGNDDSGTMSAWYVFSALGVFPIAGTADFVLGTPLFTHATLHLPGGELVIDAPLASDQAIYPREIQLDRERVDTPTLSHARLASGGLLSFDLSASP
ncbi:MAG: GH92 family glycosyl hydrolase [Sandaracinaceae bacterium]|nr:GH92 family glycosyl hydrolase [Sandaracinaceae bacterium]